MMNYYLWLTVNITAYTCRCTLDGDYIGKFGNHGDELCYPESITIDSNDFILVNDMVKSQVVIFDKIGNLVHKFGSYGSGDDKFSIPRGKAVNKNGVIYVSGWFNKRVHADVTVNIVHMINFLS